MDRAPLTGKKDAKAIKRLNAAQRMHEGLNHQDVVALEQEYTDKMGQFNEREVKVPKIDLQPAKLPTQSIEPITGFSERGPSTNTAPYNTSDSVLNS